jgi:hypothetical protein
MGAVKRKQMQIQKHRKGGGGQIHSSISQCAHLTHRCPPPSQSISIDSRPLPSKQCHYCLSSIQQINIFPNEYFAKQFCHSILLILTSKIIIKIVSIFPHNPLSSISIRLIFFWPSFLLFSKCAFFLECPTKQCKQPKIGWFGG